MSEVQTPIETGKKSLEEIFADACPSPEQLGRMKPRIDVRSPETKLNEMLDTIRSVLPKDFAESLRFDTAKGTCVVYRATNRVNGKIYIGKSKNFLKRQKQHIKQYTNACPKFYAAMRKYGSDVFDWDVLFEGTEKQCLMMERRFIVGLRTNTQSGYNVNEGGKFGRPKKSYPKGSAHPNFGKTLSAGARAKISAAHTGKKYTPDKTTYTFKNSISGEVFTGTRYEFGKFYSLSNKQVNELFKDALTYKGWRCLEKKAVPSVRQEQLCFENILTGEIFKGTRLEFSQRCSKNATYVHALIRRGHTTRLGWRLKK